MKSVPPNMSPDEKLAFERDRAAEERVQSMQAPDDPQLAADWRLKRELVALAAPPLPAALRQRVLARTSRAHRPARWLAAAAILAGVSVTALWQQPFRESPSDAIPATVSAAQLEDLRLALATLGDSGEFGLRLAGEQLAAGVAAIEFDAAALPWADRLQRLLRPARNPGPPPT